MRGKTVKPYAGVLLRQFTGNPGRFVAIMIISALGVAFFAGLRVTGPYMRAAANAYYNGQTFMDAYVRSPLGLSDKDIEAMRAVPGVTVQPGYTAELSARMGGRVWNLRVISLPDDTQNMINRPALVAGRMPRRRGECVIDAKTAWDDGAGGLLWYDSLELFIDGEDEDEIKKTVGFSEYAVVGVVDSPLHRRTQRGSSATKYYIYIPQRDFELGVYTEAAVKVHVPDGLARYDPAYGDFMERYINALEEAGERRSPLRYMEVLDEGLSSLKQARDALDAGERALEDTELSLAQARERLAEGERAYNAALSEYVAGITDARQTLDARRRDLDDAGFAVYDAADTINRGYLSSAGGRASLDAARQQLDEGMAALEALREQRAQLASQLYATDSRSPYYAAMAENLARLDVVIDEQTAALEDGLEGYEASLRQYEESAALLDAGRAQAGETQRSLEEGRRALDAGWAELDAARLGGALGLYAAQQELDAARAALNEGEAAYLAEKDDVREELDDAREAIDDAQDDLDALEPPEWMVTGAEGNADFSEYKDNCDRIEAISQVFPLIFFLVAALVTLTNMTRTVEDERSLMATLTALGYSNGSILFKYILFAAVSTLSGCAIGLAVGFTFFPSIIFNAYGIMYEYPPVPALWDGYYAVLSTLLAMTCSIIPAALVCVKELRTTPASLMLPRAPKPGKRIWMERIGILWRRLSFTQKVTARNIFRYKSRMIMTVVGVAGCTALLLVGFGIRDSIQDLVELQFTEIRKYDMDVGIKETGRSYEEVRTRLEAAGAVTAQAFAYVKEMDVYANGEKVSASLTVPMDTARISAYVTLRERGGKDVDLSLLNEGAVITEKLSSLLHVSAGDAIQMERDGVLYALPVAAICENYTMHYVNVGPALYAAVFGEEAAPNWAMCMLKPMDQQGEERLRRELMQNGAQYVGYSHAIRETFSLTMKSLDMVVWVLIVSAAALACVVLFSLTLINIDERKRELATITVLGFYDGEVAAYVYREIFILTLLGAAAGLVLGVFLHRFIIITAELDLVMFARQIKPLSYALSVTGTLIFGLLVDAAMLPMLRRINMVESLKSVD